MIVPDRVECECHYNMVTNVVVTIVTLTKWIVKNQIQLRLIQLNHVLNILVLTKNLNTTNN